MGGIVNLRLRCAAVVFAAAVLSLVIHAQEGGARKKLAYDATPPIRATLIIGAERIASEAELVGRSKDGRLVATVKFKTVQIDPSVVVAVDFATDYVDDTVEVLLREEKFQEAADLLVRTYAAAVPYLDLAENNAAEPLLNAGSYYLKAADKEALKTGKLESTPESRENYQRAFRVYRGIVRADWFSGSRIAEAKALFCLLRLGMVDAVEKALAEMVEPEQGEVSFGIYWLVRAHLHRQKDELRETIEAAARSLVFETKDLDSFPEALFLTAECYEDLFEYHRCRDVYYEVAKLFQRTDLGEIAFRRLQFIMDQGFPRKAEEVAIERVFFDAVEDVNKTVDEFIVARLEEERKLKEQEELRKKQEEVEAQINE